MHRGGGGEGLGRTEGFRNSKSESSDGSSRRCGQAQLEPMSTKAKESVFARMTSGGRTLVLRNEIQCLQISLWVAVASRFLAALPPSVLTLF